MTAGNSYHFVFDVHEYGGHEVITLEIISALARRNDVRVTAPSYNRLLADALSRKRAEGLSVELTFLGNERGGRLGYIVQLARSLRRQASPNTTTIIPQGWPTGAIGAVAAAMLSRTERLVSYLPMSVPATGSRLQRAVKGLALRLCKAAFRRVVTISEPIARRLALDYPRHAIVALENRVGPPTAVPTAPATLRQQLGLPLDRHVVAIIGRIDFKQKGQARLVEAVNRCLGLRDTVFAFVGTGRDEAALRQLIASDGASQQFVLLPWRNDIARLLHAFDAIAMPSLFEGVPLVMLEALLGGVAFVGSRETSVCIPGLDDRFFTDFDDPNSVERAVVAATSRSTPPLSVQEWTTLMDRFCPADEVYVARCEASFAAVPQ